MKILVLFVCILLSPNIYAEANWESGYDFDGSVHKAVLFIINEQAMLVNVNSCLVAMVTKDEHRHSRR